MQQSQEIELLRAQTRRLVDRGLRPRTLEIERERHIPGEIVVRLRELGCFELTIPERYGGLGISTLAHLVVQELGSARAGISMLISGNSCIGVMALVLHGTRAQRERWLPNLASGNWLAAFTLTEPNADSDAQAIETRAVRSGDDFILNGTTHYISRDDIAHSITVFAITDNAAPARAGITTFIVEKGTPGFTIARIQESMGSDAVKQGELVFEDCRVSADQVVGEVGPGFATATRVLDLSHLALAARCLGAMEVPLALSAAHANRRVYFGKPIADQPVIADTTTDIALLRPALSDAALRGDVDEDDDSGGRDA